jgi:archaellum component FlaF (FlaF/FlaG flagellin family)
VLFIKSSLLTIEKSLFPYPVKLRKERANQLFEMEEKIDTASVGSHSVGHHTGQSHWAIEKTADECPILNVVVYRDRAEITRSVAVNCEDAGEVKLIIYALTKCCNPDSIRVKTVESKCDILEVSHEQNFVSKSAKTNKTSENDISKAIEELEDHLKQCTAKIDRSNSQRDLLRSFADNVFSNQGHVTTRVPVEEAKSVLEYYQTEVATLDDTLFLLEKDKVIIVNELEAQRKKLSELTNDLQRSHDANMTLFVTLEVKKPEEVKLQFSYVVSNATWSPSYDLRVTSADNSLALSYFAEVTQTTGENWKDCELFLSTSNPSMGSSPPPLPSKSIDISRPYEYYGAPKTSRGSVTRGMIGGMIGGVGGGDYGSARNDRASSFSLLDDNINMNETVPMSMQQSQAPSDFRKAGVVGTGDLGSTVFTINRKVTIDCDNKPHKVMITARNFKPQMVHYAVPSVSPHVYIQAKTKNNSPYPLLSSDNVSIYLDGNFMSKSSLKQANTGESFQVFIGVDPAVKVEYLPVRNEEYRKGWVLGTEVKKVHHTSILHNSKSAAVRIILAETLPRSSNEKISIELVEPAPNTLTEGKANAISETSAQDALANLTNYSENEDSSDADALPKDFVTKNKNTNNIVWLKTLPPQEKVQINFVYKIAWPQGSQISEYSY